jgi:protocatechuate 3,4-dioxygenase, beta subunit
MSLQISRRTMLRGAALAPVFWHQSGAFAQALTRTPALTIGPYYPDRLPLDQDNDLLLLHDNITPAVGEIMWVSGRVLDSAGSPVRGAVVEICDLITQLHFEGEALNANDGVLQGVRDAAQRAAILRPI